MVIGVIADTHGLLDPAVLGHLRGVDHILHAGDIGARSVVEGLERLAPVTAVSGNVDGYEASGFPREVVLELGGRRIALRHVLFEKGRMTAEGLRWLERVRPDICVFGHTHQPTVGRHGGWLLFNPGSAGPKRFRLPRGVGILTIDTQTIAHRHVTLADRPASRPRRPARGHR